MFNVTRRETSPDSLKGKNWRGKDVAEALRIDFLDKCYLCESKEPLSFNIEHFDAHRGDEEKKYVWTNLFFACARCNNFKGTRTNILDCTDPAVDTLRLIKHTPPTTPYSQTLNIEPMSDAPLVIETANLIREIFNLDDTGNRMVAGAYLRKKVFRRYYELLRHINTYEDDYSLQQDKDRSLEHIKNLMSKKHEYSAFLRWAVLDSPELALLVEDYID